jgi:hypothetical protein
MVLIPCPGCGRLVSDRGTSCPDCASPIQRQVAAESAPQRSPRRFFEEEPLPKKSRGCGHLFIHVPLLLAVLVTAGVTATRYRATERSREAAYVATLTSDLRSLAAAQEGYHAVNATYGTIEDLGVGYLPSQGVTVRVIAANGRGWHAVASHIRTETFCTITVGTGLATIDGQAAGEPTCGDGR